MKVLDMKEGDLFRLDFPYHNRVFTIRDGLLVSVSDGWAGLLEDYEDHGCEPIEMPQTPYELIQFIREFQEIEDE